MKDHRPIPLWNHAVPRAVGTESLDTPSITVHRPSPETANGCGVIIAPGGGYRILASDHEGLQVASALNQRGITAFVLKYRVAPTYPSTVSLLDGQRAVRMARLLGKKLGLHCMGFLGFSAGGHLTVAVGTSNSAEELSAEDEVDRQSSNPDFLVPVYAVTNGAIRGRKAEEYFATETQVNESTPPTFLVHTHEDKIVPPEQSVIFYNALLAHNVPAEMHIFGHGEHGVGLASGDPDTRVWIDLLFNWLRRNKFLTPKHRVAVQGKVELDDDEAMRWLTFIPNDDKLPIGRTRIWPGQKGRFELPSSHGLVPGEYTLQIQTISRKWPHDALGDYTVDAVTSEERQATAFEDGSVGICSD